MLAMLAMLEVLSRTEVIPSAHFPPVTTTFQTLLELVGERELWTNVGHTMQGWAIGLGIAAAVGIPSGMLIGSRPLLYRCLRLSIEFLRPIPSVALIPLAVIVYGTGLEMKVFLVAFASFWPLLFQALYGVQDVDPVLRDTARSFRLGPMSRLVRVTMPSAAPYIATGVRISASVALVLAVTAELVVGAPGLGRAINIAHSSGAVRPMYALIIVAGLLGWAVNAGFRRAERNLLHWHPMQRGGVEA